MKEHLCKVKKYFLILLLAFTVFLPETADAQRRGGGMRRAPSGAGRPTQRPAQRPQQQPRAERQPRSERQPKADRKQKDRERQRDQAQREDRGQRAQQQPGQPQLRDRVTNKGQVRENFDKNKIARRDPNRTYDRPPRVQDGNRYFTYNDYRQHPYQPIYYPNWRPWGFVAGALTATAVAVAVANSTYWYDDGIYYMEDDYGGYTVVEAPEGAVVPEVPEQTEPVAVNDTVAVSDTAASNYFYYAGTFYEKSNGGYKVVAPVAGTLVDALPQGGQEVQVGDAKYVKLGNTYYQPVAINGKDMYEVVLVEPEKTGSPG